MEGIDKLSDPRLDKYTFLSLTSQSDKTSLSKEKQESGKVPATHITFENDSEITTELQSADAIKPDLVSALKEVIDGLINPDNYYVVSANYLITKPLSSLANGAGPPFRFVSW